MDFDIQNLSVINAEAALNSIDLTSFNNDYNEHKELKERGYDIIILDHHEAPHYSEDAITINNQLS